MQAEDFAHLYSLEQDFWWFAGMREITATLLEGACAPARSRLVLDAGCGTGGNLAWLERYAGAGGVVGIDLSPDALNFCGERQHNRLARSSVTDLPFADSVFDLVTSFDVLVQLGGAADERALGEMYRVLRPDGIALVRVASYQWLSSGHDQALGSRRRYSLPELVRKIERAGFTTLRATYANSFLLPIAVLRRLLLKRVGLADRGSDVKPLPGNLRWLNRVLTGVLRREASMLRTSRLPFGLSAICVAQRPRG